MSSRMLFGMGAIGDLVKELQQALISSGCDLKTADRVYGSATFDAVKQFQSNNSLPSSGTVDDTTWQALMQRPAPKVSDRCLQVTAAFEGHGFDLAVGNFDGALLTWGIIGYTLASGEIQSIVNAVNSAHPELVQKSFGDSTQELLDLVSGTSAFQKQWADEHTLKSGALADPWRSMFATFGSLTEVQAEQVRHAQQDYLNPAIKTATKLGFSSELGLALCFDIHVQNGGVKSRIMKSLLQEFQGDVTELDRRTVVANAVADSASAKWREDVRRRKLTVATGEGTVHGHQYTLANWGLSGKFSASELTSPNALAAPA